tara:strand:+ start:5944 stop:6564 length:621 start_codon:yes stop_codon:yes gene_type:complete
LKQGEHIMSENNPQTAKVPEGVSVEPPVRSKSGQPGGIRIPGIPNVEYDPGLPRIVNPHYTNNKRTELACVLLRPDGQCMMERGIPKDNNNPLYRDIKNQYSEEEIDLNTQREVIVQNSLAKASDAFKLEEKRKNRREQLWNQKTTFLDMDLVKNTKHKMLKRKLRQATTPEEAQALGMAILIKEYDVLTSEASTTPTVGVIDGGE